MKKSFIATIVIIAVLVIVAYRSNFFSRLGCSSCCKHQRYEAEAEPVVVMEEASMEPMDNDMVLDNIQFEEMMELPEQPE